MIHCFGTVQQALQSRHSSGELPLSVPDAAKTLARCIYLDRTQGQVVYCMSIAWSALSAVLVSAYLLSLNTFNAFCPPFCCKHAGECDDWPADVFSQRNFHARAAPTRMVQLRRGSNGGGSGLLQGAVCMYAVMYVACVCIMHVCVASFVVTFVLVMYACLTLPSSPALCFSLSLLLSPLLSFSMFL